MLALDGSESTMMFWESIDELAQFILYMVFVVVMVIMSPLWIPIYFLVKLVMWGTNKP